MTGRPRLCLACGSGSTPEDPICALGDEGGPHVMLCRSCASAIHEAEQRKAAWWLNERAVHYEHELRVWQAGSADAKANGPAPTTAGAALREAAATALGGFRIHTIGVVGGVTV